MRQVVDHGLDGGTARTFALRSASNPVSYGPHRIAPAVTNEPLSLDVVLVVATHSTDVSGNRDLDPRPSRLLPHRARTARPAEVDHRLVD